LFRFTHFGSFCRSSIGDGFDSWDALHNAGPNPHIIFGALVGGPNQNDEYADDRENFKTNEVACDYNAGFQSVLAGIVEYICAPENVTATTTTTTVPTPSPSTTTAPTTTTTPDSGSSECQSGELNVIIK
jgi:hypothetical protein